MMKQNSSANDLSLLRCIKHPLILPTRVRYNNEKYHPSTAKPTQLKNIKSTSQCYGVINIILIVSQRNVWDRQ